MRTRVAYHCFVLLGLFYSCSQNKVNHNRSINKKDSSTLDSLPKVFLHVPKLEDTCICDSNPVIKLVQQQSFNRIEQYDKKSFSKKNFYDLDSSTNRTLWFRDIENPKATKFTELWDAYWKNNYYADPSDFVNFYDGKTDIQLAFIFGPNSDLWAYHIFVIKKINSCYLITRSYYRHNRFTYKAFSIFDKETLNDLYRIISRINLTSLEVQKKHYYNGFFMDNLGGNKFFIDFENEVNKTKDIDSSYTNTPKQEVMALYEFVDKRFHWTITYGN